MQPTLRHTITSFALLLAATAANAQNYSWTNLPVIQKTAFRKDTVNITQASQVAINANPRAAAT